MASSLEPKMIYDVFLSFRGADLRNNFIGHLYQALHRDGVYTFRDSEELKKGDQISLVLMKAIEESCIAIIIFSEDYASSRWCLEELAKIIECKEQKNLIVLPVFYKVDPREVREGRKSYQRSLAKLEFKLGNDSEKVKRWKKALSDAGNLSGWHLNDGNESELIQRIVKEISTRLNRTPLHVAKHPTGIDSQVVKLKLMLHLESDDDVVMVGLWGQGGIGKSTLARALYNAIFRQFEGSCLLANVREAQNSKDLISLQENLLLEILSLQQKLEVSNVERGINLIQHRLCHKKVLLILDDVNNLCQLHALIGEGKWFRNGSRIIVTTRDNHLLTYLGIDQDHAYEVRELNNNDARELFSKHAFPTHQNFRIRTDLVDSVLNHAKGLPLALEVLGSFLRGRREYEWESALDDISTAPTKGINDVLKVSYDGLEPKVKEIFLHIACFFKGWDSEYVKKVLDSCDLKAVIGLKILMERSLIRSEFGKLQMHDLIQLMGMDIVNQESDDPGRRSRLWQHDDVVDVLSNDMGNCVVKAIVLMPSEPIEMCISPDAFTKMRRLRLLILHNVHDSFQGPICLPNELRWVEWTGCARQIAEFSSGPKKLVGLNISEGNITRVVKRFKDFQQLKYVNFSNCESLVHMPDLSCTPNLEELVLCDCKNLVEAHESIAYHDKLQLLNLRGCRKIDNFPNIPCKLEGLKKLCLQGTTIKELPVSIENLVSLKIMDLSNCKNLASLPSSIYKLQNIELLELAYCTNLIGFPKYEDSADLHMNSGLSNLLYLSLGGCHLGGIEFLENPSCFPFLQELVLAESNVASLPMSICERDHLTVHAISYCQELQEIPELPPILKILSAINCKSLQKTGDVFSSAFVRRVLTTTNLPSLNQMPSDYIIWFLGEEMPEWVLPIEERSISFMALEDLYDKFLIVTLCAVFSNDDQAKYPIFEILPHVNGEMRDCKGGRNFLAMDSDQILLWFFTPYDLWGEVNFSQIDRSYVHFSLTVSTAKVKKWGFRIICKPLEDDLKIGIQDNRLIDLALLHEVVLELTDLEVESPLMHKDNLIKTDLLKYLQDCQRRSEEHSQIVSKGNTKLILPHGMKTKNMMTSDSTNRDEHASVGLQLLLLE